MTSSAEDIWSTRLQRELLALTSEEEGNKKNIGVLPPFVTVNEHHLDIVKGICKVSFGISIDDVVLTNENDVKGDESNNSDDGGTTDQTSTVEKEEEASATADETKDVNDSEKDDGTKAEGEKEEAKDETSTTSTHTGTTATQNNTNNIVIITLDASLQYKYGAHIPDASTSYPFFKPKAYLSSGASLLPPSIGIQDGALIQIDCDWTPSLHLNDAALNIALKVRESVRRGEACLRVETSKIFGAEENAFDAKVSSFFTSLKSKASALVEEVDNKLDVAMREKPRLLNRRREKLQQQQQQQESGASKVVTEENVENGDVIDLSQKPWNEAVGMYPCRAIRRPAFIEAAIKAASDKSNSRKVSDDVEDEDVIPYGVGNYLQLQAGSVFQVGVCLCFSLLLLKSNSFKFLCLIQNDAFLLLSIATP